MAGVFIHESIKTRVETLARIRTRGQARLSLSMNPLKQGLKRNLDIVSAFDIEVFIHESIKTRVETSIK